MGRSIAMTLACAAYCGIFGSAGLRAAEIHKCAGPQGSIAYQTAPCDSGQREVALLTTPSSTRGETVAVQIAPPEAKPIGRDGPRAQWLPFAHRGAIAAGMTDDEVLNAPGGGVPAHIARSRAGRSWREVWTYARNGEVRELEFVNGRLASIGDASASGVQSLRIGDASTGGRPLAGVGDRTANYAALRVAARLD